MEESPQTEDKQKEENLISAEILKCSQCNYFTCSRKYGRKYIKRHLMVTHGDKPEKAKSTENLKCTKCSYLTTNKAYLKRHLRVRHSDKIIREWLSCKKCEFKTKYEQQLTRHVSKHEVFRCFNCDYEAKGSSRNICIRKHILRNHRKTKLNKCAVCNYRTTFKSALMYHVRSRHGSNHIAGGWEECSSCKFVCASSYSLKLHHLHAHTKRQNLFNCDHCSFKSRFRFVWRSHVLYKHIIGFENDD